jgi:hypothetical protein
VGSEINTRLALALERALTNVVDTVVDWCTDDEDEIDCAEWLKELENSYLLLSVLYPSPMQGQALKLEHDRSVDLFCASCPEECP